MSGRISRRCGLDQGLPLLSRMSMARRALPSRLELKRTDGSDSEAPLAKVSLTLFLYVSPMHIIPTWGHTAPARAPGLSS